MNGPDCRPSLISYLLSLKGGRGCGAALKGHEQWGLRASHDDLRAYAIIGEDLEE